MKSSHKPIHRETLDPTKIIYYWNSQTPKITYSLRNNLQENTFRIWINEQRFRMKGHCAINLKQNYALQSYNVLNKNGSAVNRNRRHLIPTNEKFT